MLHSHTFPLHNANDLLQLLSHVPMERLEKLDIRRDRGCDPEWTVTLQHWALTHSEMHRILMKMPEGASLVPYLESFHTP